MADGGKGRRERDRVTERQRDRETERESYRQHMTEKTKEKKKITDSNCSKFGALRKYNF